MRGDGTHRGEPLNELADALASEAAESDPVCSIALDHDSEAVYLNLKGTWVEWNTRVREDLVQRAAGQYVASILQPKRGRAGSAASPPSLPLTASWLLRPNQGRSTLGKVLGEMKVSTAKKQVRQSIAGAFPCNAVLHKWGRCPRWPVLSLRSPSRDAEPHPISLSCPQGGQDRDPPQHGPRLLKGIKDSTRGWTMVTEQTVAPGPAATGRAD